jgi:hypothetical protein
VLVEIIALATGVFPKDHREKFKPKFRGPVACRIIVESLTTVLEPVILPKLQWWKWTGVGEQGIEGALGLDPEGLPQRRLLGQKLEHQAARADRAVPRSR